MKKIDVAVVMGSKSDLKIARETQRILEKFSVGYQTKILSAHRTPEATSKFAKEAESKGLKVIIALAGKAAHLAGVIAAYSNLPVIGVPVNSAGLKGIDSLFSTVQMPKGVPVGCMAIGKTGAQNAAYYAIEILSLESESLKKKIKRYKKEQASRILKLNL